MEDLCTKGLKMSEIKKTVHQQLNSIQKELNVPKNQLNKFGNYNYRSCEDIVEAAKPLLGNCVLTLEDELIHFPSNKAPITYESIDSKGNKSTVVVEFDRFYIKATATLSDGINSISNTAFARESLDKKGMDESQITGATSSYARKYALNGLFAIDDTKDADTQDNSKEVVKKVLTKPTEKTPEKPAEITPEEVKKTVIKKMYGVINGQGHDPKEMIVKLAVALNKGSLGSIPTETLSNVLGDLKKGAKIEDLIANIEASKSKPIEESLQDIDLDKILEE